MSARPRAVPWFGPRKSKPIDVFFPYARDCQFAWWEWADMPASPTTTDADFAEFQRECNRQLAELILGPELAAELGQVGNRCAVIETGQRGTAERDEWPTF